jgi:hypothetical protein
VPPFGVPGPLVPMTGPDAGPDPVGVDEVAPVDLPSESADEQYRTVAAAGPDPLERAERVEQGDRLPRAERVDGAGPPVSTPAEPESETVAPEAPAPVDLDAESTAERIAALWRTPPPDEILSDEHPISAWTEGPVGVTFSGGDEEPAASAPPVPPAPGHPVDVDPDAATGNIPVVGAAPPYAPLPPEETSGVDGRVRRSRHSRETGEIAVPVEAPGPAAPGPSPTATNGHHHGPEGRDAADDMATGPVQHPGGPAGAPEQPAPATSSPSAPDSFDSQLSERERELLARLHEELASRERLEADAPDPLLGRPPQAPPGSEDTTAPRPRPTGPYPGPARPPGPPAPYGPAGTNGHAPGPVNGPVNGHGLPRRHDHDDEDGPTRDA